VLLSADRTGVMAIARAVGMSKVTVSRWQERYLAKGITGLRRDATRPGRKPPLSAETIQQVVHKTLHEKPPAGTHWSIRTMAVATALSRSSIQRIWQAHQLKPHRVKTFKLSNDKHSASWINQVERFFGLITGDRIRCGVFKSVAELVAAIQQYLEHHNADPKPFVWTASATAILEKVARGRQTLESVH